MADAWGSLAYDDCHRVWTHQSSQNHPKLDEERERLNRKLSVFRTLMQTRRARTNQNHVGALNLIEVEFYDIEPVRAAYRIYVRHLGSALPTPDQQDRYFEEREDLYADLLHAMGLSLGYTFDKRELMRLAYVPILWQDDFMLQRRNATLLAEGSGRLG
jgi:hypothetical protein